MAENNFCDKLKCPLKSSYIKLPYDSDAVHKEFHSEYAAKQVLKEYLREPYNAASAIVNPQNINCVARTLAEEYSQEIINCFETSNLKTLFEDKKALYEKLNNLVSNSAKTLREKFLEEIDDDYYKMYDFNYFVNKVNIEEHDYRSSEGVLRIIEALFPDSIEYTYCDFFGSVYEMEKDLDDHLTLFYELAHKEYLEYVKEIEKVFEKLEKSTIENE